MKKIISKFLVLVLILPTNFAFAKNWMPLGKAQNQNIAFYDTDSIQHIGQSLYAVNVGVFIESDESGVIQGQKKGSTSGYGFVIDCSKNLFAIGWYKHYAWQDNKYILISQQKNTDVKQLVFNYISPNSPESVIASKESML